MKKVIKRLREPSTMAGLGVLAVLFGLPESLIGDISRIVGGLAGVAAVLVPELGDNS
ncbi:hypothetical protein [Lacisediminimonas profundi]|uniref:hypothetical protein n=1 Tax=Lacisediminimonas profundi TaxID=2603856 RepID=UPI00140CD22F|nr:hypothetical protein [Lacisediminimonas profundi]